MHAVLGGASKYPRSAVCRYPKMLSANERRGESEPDRANTLELANVWRERTGANFAKSTSGYFSNRAFQTPFPNFCHTSVTCASQDGDKRKRSHGSSRASTECKLACPCAPVPSFQDSRLSIGNTRTQHGWGNHKHGTKCRHAHTCVKVSKTLQVQRFRNSSKRGWFQISKRDLKRTRSR